MQCHPEQHKGKHNSREKTADSVSEPKSVAKSTQSWFCRFFRAKPRDRRSVSDANSERRKHFEKGLLHKPLFLGNPRTPKQPKDKHPAKATSNSNCSLHTFSPKLRTMRSQILNSIEFIGFQHFHYDFVSFFQIRCCILPNSKFVDCFGENQQLFLDAIAHTKDKSAHISGSSRTTLSQHFFGKDGSKKLEFNHFLNFIRNLQTEILQVEFMEYSKVKLNFSDCSTCIKSSF